MGITTCGERIAAARAHAGLSRSHLAALCSLPDDNVAERNIYRWEIEDVTPRAAVLLRLADALGVDERWIITGDSPPPWIAATGTDG